MSSIARGREAQGSLQTSNDASAESAESADPYANIPPSQPGAEPYYHKFAAADAIPQAVDLPIDLVNRVLYPPRRRQRVD